MKASAIVLVILSGCTACAAEWAQLPSLPDAHGLAGALAGVSGGALVVAGGANFPDKKPWDGGKKVWHDAVFVLENPTRNWKIAGRLPHPLAYGVSVTHRSGVICVGGSDAGRHYADVFKLEWQAGKLITTALPRLPRPIANACGALVGDVLYLAGGQTQPDAAETLKKCYQLDLAASQPHWQEIEPWPGCGRMLAVASGVEGTFWLAGGVELIADNAAGKDAKPQRRYLRDAYRYERTSGWRQIADLPSAIAAAPSPAPADKAGWYIVGGDDGSQVGVDFDKHRGFSTKILRYDIQTQKWVEGGQAAAARVTVPCVFWNSSWVVPSGEVRPGVRSPEVWAWTPAKKD